MNQRPLLLFPVVLLLGVFHSVFFWDQPLGMNFPLFIIVCLVLGTFVLAGNSLIPSPRTLWLYPLATFFALMVGMTSPYPLSLPFRVANVLTYFSLALLTVSYCGGRWMEYNEIDYGLSILRLAGGILTGPVRFVRRLIENLPENPPEVVFETIRSILRGLTIAFPVMVVFFCLLAYADLMFSQELTELSKLLDFKQSGEILRRLPGILLWAYLLAGVIIYAGEHSTDEVLNRPNRQAALITLRFADSAIILACVSLPLFLFAAIRISTILEAGNISKAGQNPGSFILLTLVGWLSLMLVVLLSELTRREIEWQHWIHSVLNLYVLLMVILVLIAANESLTLEPFWDQEFRLYARGFLAWMGALFAVFVVLDFFRRTRQFAYYAVIITFVFGALLCLRNVKNQQELNNREPTGYLPTLACTHISASGREGSLVSSTNPRRTVCPATGWKPASKINVTREALPGGMTLAVSSAVAQPQVVYAWAMTSGALPRLITKNSRRTTDRAPTTPKS